MPRLRTRSGSPGRPPNQSRHPRARSMQTRAAPYPVIPARMRCKP
uniref:Uncharacterized protein n=1 Tax=Arundo donax TaxID=35708 RepID=A0A0A9HTG8_ARUDO